MFFVITSNAGAVPKGKTLEWDGKGAGKILFDNRIHSDKGLKCSNCHPGFFKMKKGADPITMRDMEAGKYCGACHDGRQAFAVNDRQSCGKCHNGNGWKQDEAYIAKNNPPASSYNSQSMRRDTTPPELVDISIGGERGVRVVEKVTSSSVMISGLAKDDSGVAAVYINGIEANLDKEGRFSLDTLLKVGENTLTITAVDVYRNKAEKTITVTRDQMVAASPVRRVTDASETGSQTAITIKGRYYAFVIGINNYRNIPGLNTASYDAKKVSEVLSRLYGFEVKTLIDAQATRDSIVRELNALRKMLMPDDKLLIYYAGHGYYNAETNKAYWLPVDAEKDDTTNWVMADDITSQLKLASARQILIVSDSCYSGTLTRSLNIDLSAKSTRTKYLNKILNKSSRLLIASGGNEPVADAGGRGHSVFAQAFVDGLTNMNDRVFTAEELFIKQIKEPVAGKAEQTPEFKIIHNSGHDGGDFVFMRK